MTVESIVCTCDMFPNQFSGVVDGKPFYFRARHGEWRLEVCDVIVAQGCANDEPDGAWDPADAERFVRTQLDHYSAGRCPHCEGTGRAVLAQDGAPK